MDDRSLVTEIEAQLETDVRMTNAFDQDTGAVENEGKRQVWKRGEGKEVEHIGRMAKPDDPGYRIKLAAGWHQLRSSLKQSGTMPGPRVTRAKAAGAYARPLWTW